MTAQTMQIGSRPCRIYGEAHAEYLLLQMTGGHELQSMDDEVAAIAQSNRKYLFAAIPAESWNDELSPWKAPAVWGKQGFGGNAADTLRFLTEQVIPSLKQQFDLPENVKIILGGYSLAGLFALWASTQTDLFYGIAAASPSVWFPGWMEFEQRHPMQAQRVYLSLGDKEEHTKNAVMAAVGDNIRALRSRENADPLQLREQMLAFLLRIYHEGRAERCLHVETLIDQFGQVHTIDQYREQLLGLISYITGSRDEGGATGVAEVKHYIDEHYSEEITLKTMSELVHLSPAYLSYAFKEEFDINFNDYLTAVRIEQAKHLLTQTDLKVYEVCAKVGYKDKKYFTDLFKKHTGMLPRDWK